MFWYGTVESGVGDHHAAVLQRLPQALDGVPAELGQLVEEQDSVGAQCSAMPL
jgi:hypothetical protein